MANTVLHEHPLGLSWTMDESMARSSHALNDDGRIWLVDPVDDNVAIERMKDLGEVAGVIQLLDRHRRDCAALADRFDAPLYATANSIDDSPFEVVPVVGARKWKENALWWEEKQALIVSEAIGTSKMFTGGHDAGVHLFLRLKPPKKKLGDFEPQHLLVGHGPPIHGAQAASALQGALERSRRNLPRTVVGAFRNG
jgi:hypothetical protein